MPQIKSTFILRSKAPNFERDSFETLLSMRNVNPGWMDEGHISYCRETRKHYVFSSYNEYNETVGYFKPLTAESISGGNGDSSTGGECCCEGSCGIHYIFDSLAAMRNINIISEEIELGQIVYCKETRLPYYSDYDRKLPSLDSNQAYFDDETGYFRSFTVSVDVKDLQEDLNDLADRVSNLEKNGTPTGPSGNYITEEELNNKGYLTEIPEGYITEEELNNKGYLTEIPEGYVTEKELNNKGYLTEIPEGYITEEELNNKGYLTEIPEGYITEEELNNKGYVTADDIPGILDYVTEDEIYDIFGYTK